MKKLRVCIYCPDHHLSYDGSTPDKQGVGGGVMVRIRLAGALARLGHQVTMICNCPRAASYDHVCYVPLAQAQSIDTDVLILTTSGGDLDLRPALKLDIKASLRLIWVHGKPLVKGLGEVAFDYMVTPSNFIRQVALESWGIPREKLFVSHHGVDAAFFQRPLFAGWRQRDPFRLVYASHPSKGLESALGVLRILRAQEPRFELHIYGGNRLWGGADQPPDAEAGVFYHGLIGQRQLSRELQKSQIALYLQDIPEGFGLSLVEAMASGNIVAASPVGAYMEIIRDGNNGFLIQGDHMAQETWGRLARMILDLANAPDFARFIRHNALASVQDWETVAQTWTGHWEWAMDHSSRQTWAHPCLNCGGALLPLADGYHCASCGLYSK